MSESTPTLALQLYTVRAETAKDMLGTLARVAGMGYQAVEFAGDGGVPVAELRAALDGHGLRTVGCHVKLTDWEERQDEALAEVAALGGRYALIPWVPEERRSGLEAAQRLAADLNRWGAAAQAAGLGFGYHHHNFEFVPLPGAGGGRALFDVIVEETDPALVKLELDVYWAVHAGQDPIALLRRLGERAPLLHLKDMAAGPDKADRPVGEGTIDWPAVLAAAPHAEALIVEQDNPADPLADSERALRNLERLTR